MMSTVSDEFVFTWRVDGFNMLPQQNDEQLLSPTFSVERFCNTKWCLSLYPRGDDILDTNISCYLCREDGGTEDITINFEVLVNSDSSKATYVFNADQKSWGFQNVFKRPVKNSRVLIVTCRMDMGFRDDEWETNLGIPNLMDLCSLEEKLNLTPKIKEEYVSCTKHELQKLSGNLWPCPKKCYARTIVSVERRSISCKVKDIINLKRSKLHFSAPSCSDQPTLLIMLQKTVIGEIEDLEVKLCFIDKLEKNVFLVCEIQILDTDEEIRSTTSSYLFKSINVCEVWNVQNDFKVSDMMKHENAKLKFNFSISDGSCFSNIESSEIEDYQSVVSRENILQNDLFKLYTDKKFCDVTLKVSGMCFEVHKAVLCSKSSVFAAMFDDALNESVISTVIKNDTKENVTNTVIIDDVESDVISKIINFMYTGKCEILEFNQAMKLFSASEKYKIYFLKETSKNFLQDNLTVGNAISCLTLADNHQDKELRKLVADFIFKNNIFQTEEWENLSDTNPKLALQVFQYIYNKQL